MKSGLDTVRAMGVGRGSFEALGGIQNGNPFAQAELRWRINKPVSVFARATWTPLDYLAVSGVRVDW